MYNVDQLVLGSLSSNCYIISNSHDKTALIIDPVDSPEYIGEKLVSMGLTPLAMIATHGHFDHVLAAFGLEVFFPNLPFYIHKKDMFLLDRMQKTALYFSKNRVVSPSPQQVLDIAKFDRFILGKERLEILDLKGHTPGSIGVYLPLTQAVFVGDLLFAGGFVGSTDHEYSDKKELKKSIEKILHLPKKVKMYSGHGEMTLVEDVSDVLEYTYNI